MSRFYRIFFLIFAFSSTLNGRTSETSIDFRFPFTNLIDWLDASHQNLPELFMDATEYDINFEKIFSGAIDAQNHLDKVFGIPNYSNMKLVEILVYSDMLQKNSSESEMHEEKPYLTLREVPPWLSILRGIVGVDCSSQYTPFASMLPAEKTFFVYDESESLLGYISLTRDMEHNFILHDFSAPLISETQIELSLIALEHYFGKNRLLSVPSNVLHDNLNYKHIQKIIEKFILKDSLKNSLPADNAIRNNFLTFMKSKSSFDFSQTLSKTQDLSTFQSPLSKHTTISSKTKKWEILNNQYSDKRSRVNLVYLHLLNALISEASLHKLKEKLARTISPQGQIDTQRYNEIGYRLGMDNQSVSVTSLISPLRQPPKNFNSIEDLIQFVNTWIVSIAKPEYFWSHHRSMIYEMIIAQTNYNVAQLSTSKLLVIEALEAFLIKRKMYKYVHSVNPEFFSKLNHLSEWPDFNKFIISMLRKDPVLLETLEFSASKGLDILKVIGKDKRKLRRLEPYIDETGLYLPNLKNAISTIKNDSCGDSFK